GRLWIETAARLPQAVQAELKKLGATTARTLGTTATSPVSCWPELLPLVSVAERNDATEQTPVLFELCSDEALVRLATEILRLGNDRQGVRWLLDAEGAGHALLRV